MIVMNEGEKVKKRSKERQIQERLVKEGESEGEKKEK